MILDNLRALADSIVERVRNPFGGTLIVVWIIFNWEFVFTVFNFDEGQKLADKLSLINSYLNKTPGEVLLWYPIGYSFIAIFLYLFLQHTSLLIYTSFQKWAKPLVFWLVDRNKITDRESYDELKLTTIKFQKESEDLRSELLKTRNDNATLRSQAIEVQQKHDAVLGEFTEYKNKKALFIDTFQEDRGYWSKDYWGQRKSNNCRIENGEMVFDIKSTADLRNEPMMKGTGAYVDLVSGIFRGETYQISTRVRADPDSTLMFKLWVHDVRGKTGAETQPERIETEAKIINLQFVANEANAMRIHLHISEGIGKLYVTDVRVVRIK